MMKNKFYTKQSIISKNNTQRELVWSDNDRKLRRKPESGNRVYYIYGRKDCEIEELSRE